MSEQEEIASVGKLKVPDAPDSPKRASEDALAGGHKKKLKKQVVKAVAAGQKVNRDVFRAIYGAEVCLLKRLPIRPPHDCKLCGGSFAA